MAGAVPQLVQPAKPEFSSLYDPLVLYAETTLPTGAAASPNTAALQNALGLPMELLGVRFKIYTKSDDTAAAQSVSGLGVGVKMDMGKVQIVDAGVPVSLFGTARDDSDDSQLGYKVLAQPGDLDPLTKPLAQVYDYTWRLRYPMFIPSGAAVTPLFNHLTQTPYDVNIGVTYFCRAYRQSAKMPQTVVIPWVTKYVSKSFDIFTGTNDADTDESTELDIRNPFPDTSVEIARFTGRLNFYLSGDNGPAPNVNWEMLYGNQAYQYLRMTMRASRGDDLIRTPALFGSVFQNVFKTWDVPPGWCMNPNEFYDIKLARDSFTGPTAAANSARMQVGVGCVGYRKINTSTLQGAA